MRLECIGFCGVDNSVDLGELCKLSAEHPWIEWGVLLRPDKQGTPRYAGHDVLQALGRLARGDNGGSAVCGLRLAAHLCGADCLLALKGDVSHVLHLRELVGFQRLQINPTAANSASGWEPEPAAEGLRAVALALPDVELILQVNAETRELARCLFEDEEHAAPDNFAALLDASCGRGIAPASHVPPLPGVRCGYAGGIGPETVLVQLEKVAVASEGHALGAVWVDMESGVRSKDAAGNDIFDLALVRQVLDDVIAAGYFERISPAAEAA